jgi:hypothetical protein
VECGLKGKQIGFNLKKDELIMAPQETKNPGTRAGALQ